MAQQNIQRMNSYHDQAYCQNQTDFFIYQLDTFNKIATSFLNETILEIYVLPGVPFLWLFRHFDRRSIGQQLGRALHHWRRRKSSTHNRICAD